MSGIQTPFREDLTIDYADLQIEVDFLFHAKVDGVAIVMRSEVLRLSDHEHDELAAQAVEMVKGREPAVASVSEKAPRRPVATLEQRIRRRLIGCCSKPDAQPIELNCNRSSNGPRRTFARGRVGLN